MGLLGAPAAAQDESVPDALGTSSPEVRSTGPRAIIVFHPGGKGQKPRTVFKRLQARPRLSLGLMGATQGPYSVRQSLLDMSAGHRISRSGYSPLKPPRMRLEASRIRGFKAAARRASTAPTDITPGLLAESIPGGAGYVGVGRVNRQHVEAIVAADREGRVAEVSLGLATNVAKRAREMLARRRLVVVSLALGATADRALDRLMAAHRPGELLLVIRTPPRSQATQLLPTGALGISDRPGLLRTRTTRRDGLVSGHDVLPTVLESLRLPVPEAVRGRPMFVTYDHDVSWLRAQERRLRVVFPRRFPALRALAGALLLITLVGFVAKRRRLMLRVIGLGLLYVPPVTLLTSALRPTRQSELLIVAIVPFLLGWLTDRLVPWPRAPAIPAIGAVLAYCVDLAYGSALIVGSLLGPNPRFGARWYGIGNELEAILPTMLLVGLAAAVGTWGRSYRLAGLIAGAMLLLGAIVGAGRLGADVGGVITIGAAGAVAVLLTLPGQLTRRRLILAAAAPVLAILALAAIDLVTGGDSHFTGTVLGADDAGALADVFDRRTTLAYQALLRGWMPVATLVSLAVVVIGWRRRERLLAPVRDRPAWAAALAGGAAGGLIGSVANDSGPILLVCAVAVLLAMSAYTSHPPSNNALPAE